MQSPINANIKTLLVKHDVMPLIPAPEDRGMRIAVT